MEKLGLVGVHVFRDGVRRQRPAAKGDDAATQILDRKHDAITEPIKRHWLVIAIDHQSAGLDLLLGGTLQCQMFLQRIAALGRITQTIGMLRRGAQAPLSQISTGLCSASRLQLLLEELGRHLHDVVERGAFRLAYFHFGVTRRHRHARHIGNTLHGLGETQPLELRQKTEMIAGNAAAETVIAALAILAVEAR